MGGVDGATLEHVPLDRIEVPSERMRRDLGDLDTLAQSLHEHGQLAPVVVYPMSDGRLRLIAGERRLEATRRLHAARVAAGLDVNHPSTGTPRRTTYKRNGGAAIGSTAVSQSTT